MNTAVIHRRKRLIARFGAAGFAFFFLKGVAWLGVAWLAARGLSG